MASSVILQSFGAFLATGGIVIVATILFIVLYLVNRYEKSLAKR
jgi:flagellar biosynthesis component FlhA